MSKIYISNLSPGRLILLLIGLFFEANIFAQENIDFDQLENSSFELSRRANLALNSNKYDSAIYFYKKLVDVYGESNDWKNIIRQNLNISDIFFTTGAYDSAHIYAMAAKVDVLDYGISDSTLVGSLYYTLGKILARSNEVDSA